VIDEHSDALGARLDTLMRPLIDEDLSVAFYDPTTVEVAGEAAVADDVRAYGLRKSGLVARQFMLSLVQTAEACRSPTRCTRATSPRPRRCCR